ncbi:MAG: tRNA lysidine(34) synthetase TilS [Clostridia bacterium]|nr:tRNA lysidine(34) synthetase TilS [Clostridia bacterium]
MANQNATPCADYLAPWQLANLPRDTAVLLALSGGADSRALLHLLHVSSKTDGFRLVLAHVDHGIRGEESARDREFCRALAKKYGLELFLLETDVPTLAANSGRGLEEEARAVRYSFFEDLMEAQKIPILVTAHHADDNLETMLFRLCRGTGLQGLGGIAPVRDFAGGVLVRPLLRCTRREILQYCEENQLEYVTDSTNADTSYARNKIRAEVIPVLELLFDDLQKRTVEMAEDLREDEKLLSKEAGKMLASHLGVRGVPLAVLRSLSPAIRNRVLRMQFSRVSGCELQRTHVKAMAQLLADESESHAQIALPGGFCAVREFGYLQILSSTPNPAEPYSVPFTLGVTSLSSGIRISVEKQENLRKIHNLSTQICIIANDFSDIIKKGVYWRSRQEGDCILQGGMHKKLRKLYNAKKIPPRWRDALPILCDREGIVWVPFIGMRDGIANEGDGYVIRVTLPDSCQR